MADVTIYHNPNCSTSVHAVTVVKELGVDADIVLYLKTPPDAATLGAIIDRLHKLPRHRPRPSRTCRG